MNFHNIQKNIQRYKAILKQINNFRSSFGLTPLYLDYLLIDSQGQHFSLSSKQFIMTVSQNNQQLLGDFNHIAFSSKYIPFHQYYNRVGILLTKKRMAVDSIIKIGYKWRVTFSIFQGYIAYIKNQKSSQMYELNQNINQIGNKFFIDTEDGYLEFYIGIYNFIQMAYKIPVMIIQQTFFPLNCYLQKTNTNDQLQKKTIFNEQNSQLNLSNKLKKNSRYISPYSNKQCKQFYSNQKSQFSYKTININQKLLNNLQIIHSRYNIIKKGSSSFSLNQKYTGKKLKQSQKRLYNLENQKDICIRIQNSSFYIHRKILQNWYYLNNLQKNGQIILKNFNQKQFKIIHKALYESLIPSDFKHDIQFAWQLVFKFQQLEMFQQSYLFIINSIIPYLNIQFCVKILLQVYMKTIENSNQVWIILYQYCFSYFSKHSKEVVENQFFYNKITKMPNDLVYKLINQSIIQSTDNNHLIDLILIIVQSGYGNNIIQVLQNITLQFKQYKAYDSKLFNISNFQRHFLLQKFNQQNQNIIQLTQTCKNITMQLAQSLKIYQEKLLLEFKINIHTSLWTLITQKIQTQSNNQYVVYLQKNKQNYLSVFLKQTNQSKMNFNSVLFRIQLQIGDQKYDTVIFMTLLKGNQYANGIFNIAQYIHPAIIRMKIYIIQFPLHSACLHYLTIRFNQLLKLMVQQKNQIEKEIRSQRKSCQIIQKNLLQQCQDLTINSFLGQINVNYQNISIFNLDSYNIYAILNSQQLKIPNQQIVLMFICKYLLVNKFSQTFILHSLRFQYLSMKNLLTVALNHPVIKHDQLFQKLLHNQLHSRIYMLNQIKKRKRKWYTENKTEQSNPIKQMIQWLGQDHFSKFKQKISQCKSKLIKSEQNLNQSQDFTNFIKQKRTSDKKLKQFIQNEKNNQPVKIHFDIQTQNKFSKCHIF